MNTDNIELEWLKKFEQESPYAQGIKKWKGQKRNDYTRALPGNDR